jgi:hypothetical protein
MTFSKSACGNEPCTLSPYIINSIAALTMMPLQRANSWL